MSKYVFVKKHRVLQDIYVYWMELDTVVGYLFQIVWSKNNILCNNATIIHSPKRPYPNHLHKRSHWCILERYFFTITCGWSSCVPSLSDSAMRYVMWIATITWHYMINWTATRTQKTSKMTSSINAYSQICYHHLKTISKTKCVWRIEWSIHIFKEGVVLFYATNTCFT